MTDRDELFGEINTFLNSPEKVSLVSQEQIQTLILSLATARGADGFNEDEAFKVVQWAEQATHSYELLGLIYEGLVSVNIDKEDELVFGAVKGTELPN